MADYYTLRAANLARDTEWNTGSERVSVLFRGVELAGEAGEVAEVLAHIERTFDIDNVFSEEPLSDYTNLANELADIIICTDLVAMDYDINLYDALEDFVVSDLETETSEHIDPLIHVLDMQTYVGNALNTIKKLERERLGIRGSRDTVDNLSKWLAGVLFHTDVVAMDYGIDLKVAVSNKFNSTSEKVGLSTRYVL